MIQFKKLIKIKAGSTKIFNSNSIDLAFDDLSCEFFEKLSKKIFLLKKKNFSDLYSFAFFIRKSNIQKIKNKIQNENVLTGLGLAFHISPSNIPLGFAYSWYFSLLCGNRNIVKLPSNLSTQSKILLKLINNLMENKKFKKIKSKNLFLTYDKETIVTDYILKICDLKLIWGGDETIKFINKKEIKPTCKTVNFPDKYSLSIINLNHYQALNNNKKNTVVENFFNDTYLFDQNSCTTPHLVIWIGDKKIKTLDDFWQRLSGLVKKKYFFFDDRLIKKFLALSKFSENRHLVNNLKQYQNYLAVLSLKKIPKNVTNLRLGYGIFFQYIFKNMKNIKFLNDHKFQTLSYLGFKKKDFINFIYSNKPKGIDRIVPLGQSSNFDYVWDGKNLIYELTKEIFIK